MYYYPHTKCGDYILYHWSKNDRSHPVAFTYKGLVFPLYAGKDYKRQSRLNGNILIFAFFGKRTMTEAQIKRHVEAMITKGEYKEAVT